MSKNGLQIRRILPDSPAARSGLINGDRIKELNGHVIRDVLDISFYGTDELLECSVQRGNSELTLTVELDEFEPAGWEFEPLRFTPCGNNCPFCFVDQNPDGLRRTLYF
ncbi:hypothetical protein BVY01_01600, partial [bacterium I07]